MQNILLYVLYILEVHVLPLKFLSLSQYRNSCCYPYHKDLGHVEQRLTDTPPPECIMANIVTVDRFSKAFKSSYVSSHGFSVDHAQENEQEERTNQKIRTFSRSHFNTQQSTWAKIIPWADHTQTSLIYWSSPIPVHPELLTATVPMENYQFTSGSFCTEEQL